jgi:hypothetical protein
MRVNMGFRVNFNSACAVDSGRALRKEKRWKIECAPRWHCHRQSRHPTFAAAACAVALAISVASNKAEMGLAAAWNLNSGLSAMKLGRGLSAPLCDSAEGLGTEVKQFSSSAVMAQTSRSSFLSALVQGGIAAVAMTQDRGRTGSARAAEELAAGVSSNLDRHPKLAMTNKELGEVILGDIVDRQFLVTGTLTPSIYASTSTFTDEIDTYTMDQWQKGTAKLFVGNKSSVRLEPGSLHVTDSQVDFRFDEDLTFNIPLVYPVVHLTGKVVLTRDGESGLISSYREYWDQDVFTVLKSARVS